MSIEWQYQYQHGWYNVAFEQELTEPLTPVVVDQRRMMLVRDERGIRAFSADCPHRGAHLAYGGRLENNCVICPFHGYRIGLGEAGQQAYQVREYPVLAVGGLIFVRLSDEQENGLSAFLQGLAEDHVFLPGFTMPVKVAAPLVVENAFDVRHFPIVHNLKVDKVVVRDEGDILVIETDIAYPAGPMLQARGITSVRSHFLARTFSPGIIVTQLIGDQLPYVAITAATPQPDGTCLLRFSLALPSAKYGPRPDEKMCAMLLASSRRGLEDDQAIWEHLSPTAAHRLNPQDRGVIAFQNYCQRFVSTGAPALEMSLS
jgi:3-ketosteroid 9alpha-monooxygenase subunit A